MKLSNGVNVDKLDQLIKDLGVRVRLYKSTLVPSMTSLESMDQDLNDTVSDHNMIDFDCQDTIALFQQQVLMETFKIQGTFHIDEILVSFLSGITLAPFAKVELLDFEEDFYELIPRQVGTNVDFLKYKACRVLGLFTYDKATKTTKRFYEGTDFSINSDGNILWLGTNKPADTQIYSIYYKFHPVYRAIKAVHRDRYSQYNLKSVTVTSPFVEVDGKRYVKLPETWVLKREYLSKRPKNQQFDPNEP